MVCTIIYLKQTIFMGHSVTDILWLQFMLHVMLFPMLSVLYFCISTFRRMWAAIALRTGRFGNRMPVGARFSASVQTGPQPHQVSCSTGTGPFPAVEQAGRSVNHQPHLESRLKEQYSYTLRLLPVWACVTCSSVNFAFALLSVCSVPIVVISCSSLIFCVLCIADIAGRKEAEGV